MTPPDWQKEWSVDDEKRITSPYQYQLQLTRDEYGGAVTSKTIKKILAFNAILQMDERKALALAFIVERLHCGVGMMRELRENYPGRTERKFGRPMSLFSLVYTIIEDLQLSLELFGEQGHRIVMQELMCVVRGFDLEQHWRDQLTCPSEDEYMWMVVQRNCSLTRILIRVMQLNSDRQDVDLVSIADNFGLLHRLRMDNTRLEQALTSGQQNCCADLVDGRLSLPLVHSFNADSSNEALQAIIESPTPCVSCPKLVKALEQMHATGSFEHTRQVIRRLERETRSILAAHAANGYNTQPLVSLLDQLMKLSYHDLAEINRTPDRSAVGSSRPSPSERS